MLQADCSRENQFCRYGYCLCKPGFAYDQVSEDCLTKGDDATQINQLLSASKLNDRLKNEDYKKVVHELEKVKISLFRTQYIIASMMIIIIIALSGSILVILFLKKVFLSHKTQTHQVKNHNYKVEKRVGEKYLFKPNM